MRISTRATRNWASTPTIKPKPAQKMAKAEFRDLCARLNITDNATAAELLGLSWRTCQRYHYGEAEVPGPLARLLRLAVRRRIRHEELRTLADPG